MNRIANIMILLTILGNAFAQQLPQFSLRSFDLLSVNPAAAGWRANPELMLHHRSQWIGFGGNTHTQSLSYHREVTNETGLGARIMNDHTGPSNRAAMSLMYAYHIPFKHFFVSLGLSGSALHYTMNTTGLKIKDPYDISAVTGVTDQSIRPDASFGALMYSEVFYAGISVQQIIQPTTRFFDQYDREAQVQLKRHYYLTGSYVLLLWKDLRFEPSAQICFVDGAPLEVDMNLVMYARKRIICGLSYRYRDAVVFIAGLNSARYRLIYSCDISASPLIKYNFGSHELVLMYKFPVRKETRSIFDRKGNKRGQLKQKRESF